MWGNVAIPHGTKTGQTRRHKEQGMVMEKKSSETHRSICGLESANLLRRLGEVLLRSQGLEDLEDIVPELLVVLVEQDDETGGLGVE